MHGKGKGDIIIIYSFSYTVLIDQKKKGQNILKYLCLIGNHSQGLYSLSGTQIIENTFFQFYLYDLL